jgi:hypothetical protein
MKFQLLHKAVKGTPVGSLNTVTRAVHIQLLARQIHNARVLPIVEMAEQRGVSVFAREGRACAPLLDLAHLG